MKAASPERRESQHGNQSVDTGIAVKGKALVPSLWSWVDILIYFDLDGTPHVHWPIDGGFTWDQIPMSQTMLLPEIPFGLRAGPRRSSKSLPGEVAVVPSHQDHREVERNSTESRFARNNKRLTIG